MRKNIVYFTFFAVIILLSSAANAQLKRRIAVFSFEDKTSHPYRWWNGGSPGDGMADMLVTTLVKNGKYRVIERQEIDKIMQEQNLGQSGRVTQQSAVAIGRLLGVELAVFGSVSEFGYKKSSTRGRIKGIGIGVKKQSATVAIDVRIVNTTTGEILAAENVRKEESSSGLSFSSRNGRFNDRTSFDNSLVGKATRNAVNAVVALIEKQMEVMPWSGKIILVKGSIIYIKPGSEGGVKTGDLFTVYSKGEELIDPDTGLSLGVEEKKTGVIKITGLITGGKAAKAVIVSGRGMKKGDIIKVN
ncbi:hypothetical protein J7K93_12495 [bacterium]|nr:hypothetical protein [bacterium]